LHQSPIHKTIIGKNMTTDTQHENRSDSTTATDSHAGSQRPSYDDINVPVVILVGIISMVLTFATIWFVEGIYYQWQNGVVLERSYDVTNTIQSETIAAQEKMLEGDEERGILSVDSVINDVVEKFKNEHGADHTQGESNNGSQTPEKGDH